MQVEKSTIFVVGVARCSCLTFWCENRDQSWGPLGRFRGLLLLTRWLSVSCSVLTGHIYFFRFFFFFCLEPCAGFSSHSLMSPSGQCAGSLCPFVYSCSCPSSFSSLWCFFCFVFFFKEKKKEKKNSGKGITICQPAGILYIIYQKKKKNKHENYITQKPDGNDLQILHRLLPKRQIILLF